MKRLIIIFILPILACAVPAAAQYGNALSGMGQAMPISIYGSDGRKDFYEMDRGIQSFADSTVALFRGGDLRFSKTNNVYEITPVKLGDKFNLAEKEKFSNQPAISFCSGALVGKDLVLTAGHCVKDDKINPSLGLYCKDIKIVFGYAMKSAKTDIKSFPVKNVFFCAKVMAHKNDSSGDYALIKLDREASGHYPLAINRKNNLRKGTKLFVIGYPSGLPVKYSGDASVREISASNAFFKADLDTFHGNSGSPVFNAETFRIEGVLSNGGKDYVYTYDTDKGPVEIYDPRMPFAYNKGKTVRYGQNGGPGEKVMKISVAGGLIPETELEKAMDLMEKQGSTFKRKLMEMHLINNDSGFNVQPAIYYAPPEPPKPKVYEI